MVVDRHTVALPPWERRRCQARRKGAIPVARTPKRADALDAAIVALLRDDGRLTNLEIARRLGSTESTIRRRLARLMQEEGFRIVGSLDGEGRQTQMVFFVHAQPGRQIEGAERLIAYPRV